MTLELPPAGADRILVNTAATLTSYKLDQYGEPADPGTTTVTVTRADGTVIETAAATTESATSHEVAYALDAADNTRLDWLTAEWTDTGDSTTWTTYHEVVGGFYFTVAQARAADPTLAQANKWNDDLIRSVRDEVEREMESEQACNRAFVRRYRRARVHSNGCHIILPDCDIRSVRSVRYYTAAATYTSLTADELSALVPSESGVLTPAYGYAPWIGDDIVVEYEYGMDRPPSDLLRAILRRVRWYLGRSTNGIPERADQFSVRDGITFSQAQPGRNGWITADADIDLLIRRYRFERAGIG